MTMPQSTYTITTTPSICDSAFVDDDEYFDNEYCNEDADDLADEDDDFFSDLSSTSASGSSNHSRSRRTQTADDEQIAVIVSGIEALLEEDSSVLVSRTPTSSGMWGGRTAALPTVTLDSTKMAALEQDVFWRMNNRVQLH
ncbi:hypothetical protein HDU76_003574 [Blyttiomyces sp. JEL0837]|nr:hypothetical protein HDU76_003574 [Blyttiomyces sp. JEL0837]